MPLTSPTNNHPTKSRRTIDFTKAKRGLPLISAVLVEENNCVPQSVAGIVTAGIQLRFESAR